MLGLFLEGNAAADQWGEFPVARRLKVGTCLFRFEFGGEILPNRVPSGSIPAKRHDVLPDALICFLTLK